MDPWLIAVVAACLVALVVLLDSRVGSWLLDKLGRLLFGGLGLSLKQAVPLDGAPTEDRHPMRHVRVGDEGVVESPLHPVGVVRIGGRRVDATSRIGIIEAGRRVRVVRNEANRLLVEPLE